MKSGLQVRVLPRSQKNEQMFDDLDPVRVCLLDNGIKARYDMCHPIARTPLVEETTIWKYLGTGTIYSINSVKQIGEDRYHFYERITEKHE